MANSFKIYRTIFANSFEDINFDNFGCHFSMSEYFDADCLIASSEYKHRYQFCAKVKLEDVNLQASWTSNIEFEHEFEVVLFQNTEIKLLYVNEDDEEIEIIANTGNNIHKWVTDMDFEKEELFIEKFDMTFLEYLKDSQTW